MVLVLITVAEWIHLPHSSLDDWAGAQQKSIFTDLGIFAPVSYITHNAFQLTPCVNMHLNIHKHLYTVTHIRTASRGDVNLTRATRGRPFSMLDIFYP